MKLNVFWNGKPQLVVESLLRLPTELEDPNDKNHSENNGFPLFGEHDNVSYILMYQVGFSNWFQWIISQ